MCSPPGPLDLLSILRSELVCYCDLAAAVSLQAWPDLHQGTPGGVTVRVWVRLLMGSKSSGEGMKTKGSLSTAAFATINLSGSVVKKVMLLLTL